MKSMTEIYKSFQEKRQIKNKNKKISEDIISIIKNENKNKYISQQIVEEIYKFPNYSSMELITLFYDNDLKCLDYIKKEILYDINKIYEIIEMFPISVFVDLFFLEENPFKNDDKLIEKAFEIAIFSFSYAIGNESVQLIERLLNKYPMQLEVTREAFNKYLFYDTTTRTIMKPGFVQKYLLPNFKRQILSKSLYLNGSFNDNPEMISKTLFKNRYQPEILKDEDLVNINIWLSFFKLLSQKNYEKDEINRIRVKCKRLFKPDSFLYRALSKEDIKDICYTLKEGQILEEDKTNNITDIKLSNNTIQSPKVKKL